MLLATEKRSVHVHNTMSCGVDKETYNYCMRYILTHLSLHAYFSLHAHTYRCCTPIAGLSGMGELEGVGGWNE